MSRSNRCIGKLPNVNIVAAGILPYAFRNNELVFLLGRESATRNGRRLQVKRRETRAWFDARHVKDGGE